MVSSYLRYCVNRYLERQFQTYLTMHIAGQSCDTALISIWNVSSKLIAHMIFIQQHFHGHKQLFRV